MNSASPTTRMRELVASALIGTDRSSGSGTPTDLLNVAAVIGAQARAGHKPRLIRAKLTQRPDDARPIANAATMSMLNGLLANPDAGLIEEWAELARSRGVRVVDAAVPQLLDWWARQPSRASVVFEVLGKAGEWLTSLNQDWRKPVAWTEIPADADSIWQTGTPAERSALLMTIRRIDAARARCLVESTWANDGADERRRFLEVLGDGCSMADEPFLEAALDDKSKVVRRAAVQVLGKIAESRLRARMNERARSIIVVEGKRGILKRGPKVILNPPAEFETEWARDGIEEKAGGGVGQRAWWMRQILATTDLPVWNELTGLEPAAVLEAISKDDYFGDALDAILSASENSGNAEWSRALQRCLLDREKIELKDLQTLWAGLPQGDRDLLMIEAAGHKGFDTETRWAILASGDGRWSPEFSTKTINLLKKCKPVGDAWRLHDSADRISRRISPAAAAMFEEALAAMSGDKLPDSLSRSVDRVRLRADMHKEFST